MGYKGYPFSKTTYYRRKKRANELGCDIMDLPDGRGRHGRHARGEDHYRWQSGRIETLAGYTKIRVGKKHPLADPNGYALEHVLVWVSSGQSLPSGYVIHHISGDKADNRIENLRLMHRGDHNLEHLPDRDPDTGRFA